MDTTTLNAGANPDEANALIKKVLEENKTEAPKVEVKLPSDNVVTLPGGFITDTGEVITEAEVRELTGRDEEYIAKADSVGRILQAVLSRGAVKIGNEEATDEILGKILAGDREVLLLGIHRATFGTPLEVSGYCATCNEYKPVHIDLFEDIEQKKLEDPVGDRMFSVQGRDAEYTVTLPSGATQKDLQLNIDKSAAELSTMLLEGTVTEINGRMVLGKSDILNIGIADRRLIVEEITKRNPGPIWNDIIVECPDCGKEVVVPITLGSLFQF